MKNKKIEQIRFDKDKVVCISLKSHSDEQLSAICDRFSLSLDALLSLKSEGTLKVWFEQGGDYLIAFTSAGAPDYLNVCGNFSDFANNLTMIMFLKGIKQVATPKIRKAKVVVEKAQPKTASAKCNLPIVLEVDAILDKISKYGIGSIAKEEKDFLDSQY
jgi:hypothetical protein